MQAFRVVSFPLTLGNTWAECKNGTGAIGCGDQEVFRNCADVKIYSNTAGRPPVATDVYPQVPRTACTIRLIYNRDSDWYSSLVLGDLREGSKLTLWQKTTDCEVRTTTTVHAYFGQIDGALLLSKERAPILGLKCALPRHCTDTFQR